MGDAVSSLQKATLVSGGGECIVYTTLSGGMGMCFEISFVSLLSRLHDAIVEYITTKSVLYRL